MSRSIVTFAVIALVAAVAGGKQDLLTHSKILDALCANKTAELNRISQVESLIDDVRSVTCASETREGLLDLFPLISYELDDVCTDDKINQVRAYYRKYIAAKRVSEGSEVIPKSLREFFFGFGLKVSLACKRSLFNLINNTSLDVIDPEDKTTILEHLSYGKFTQRVLVGIGNIDYALLLAEASRGYIDSTEGVMRSMNIQTKYAEEVKLAKRVCARSVMPVFDQLMNKLARLSSIGLRHENDLDLTAEAEKEDVRLWLRAITACELLSIIRVVDYTDMELRFGYKDGLFKVLPPWTDRQHSEQQVAAIDVSVPVAKQTIGDVVIDANDKSSMNSIKSMIKRKRHSFFELLSRPQETTLLYKLSSHDTREMKKIFPNLLKEDLVIYKEIWTKIEDYMNKEY